MVLSVSGVDYESLDRAAQEYAVKRLEAALKAFGPGFHVYQYLFKSNRPTYRSRTTRTRSWRLPSSSGGSSLRRRKITLLKSRSSTAIVLEGSRSKTGVGAGVCPTTSRSRRRDR